VIEIFVEKKTGTIFNSVPVIYGHKYSG